MEFRNEIANNLVSKVKLMFRAKIEIEEQLAE